MSKALLLALTILCGCSGPQDVAYTDCLTKAYARPEGFGSGLEAAKCNPGNR